MSMMHNELGIAKFDMASSRPIYQICPTTFEFNLGVLSHRLIKLAKATTSRCLYFSTSSRAS